METLLFLVIAVSLAYAVGCWGRTRKIGFGLAFVDSIGINVPPVSETNVPPSAERNVPLVSD